MLDALREPQALQVANKAGAPLLTKREVAVCRCVAVGLTNRKTAARLNLREHTVKNYVFWILDKLGVSSRVELVLYVASQVPGRASDIETNSELLPSPIAAAAAVY